MVTKPADIDVETIKRSLKLKDDKFIGHFHLNENGNYTISDIRRPDFSLFILPDGRKQKEILFHPQKNHNLTDNSYYEFTWTLEGRKTKIHISLP